MAITREAQKELIRNGLDMLRINTDKLSRMLNLTDIVFYTPENSKDKFTVRDSIKLQDNLQKAASSLMFAKAWAGDLKGLLGGNSPYSDGKSTLKDIEPTDAKAKLDGSTEGDVLDIEVYKSYNLIEKIDVQRQVIKALADRVEQINLFSIEASREANIARTQIWIYLKEARFYLGFAMGNLRDGD